MSAVVGEQAPAGGQKYVNFDEYVDFQVNKTRSGIRYTDLLQAAVTVVLVVAGYLLAFVIADHWLIDGGFAYMPRLIMLLGMGAFVAVWIAFRIIRPYWKRVTALYAARELEHSQPQLKSSLLTLVDLKRAGRNVSPHIVSAMEKRAALQLSQVDVDEAVDRRPLMRLAFALLAVVVALCLYTVLSPKPIGASILRALLPVSDVGVATRTRILKVDPGDTSILARSQLEVTVDLEGEIPAEATLRYSTRDGSLVDEPVVLRDTGEGLHRFRGTLAGPNGRGLLQDFTYDVTAGDAVSQSFQVTVAQAPYATVESVTYAFPDYMGLDPKTQSGGDIDAWEGTQVTLRAVTNMPVAGATLRLHDTEDTSLKAEERPLRVVDETHLELTMPWTLEFRSDGSYPHYYSIDVRTSADQRDPVPRLYGLTIRRDLPPEIKLLHPSGDIDLPANAVLPISFTARDPDFMLRSVRMHFEKQEQPLASKTRHLYDAPPYRSELSGRGEIDLSRFSEVVKPGEVLTFWLEAWDNMAPLGNRPGNRSVTPKINIAITEEAPPEQVEQRRAEEESAAKQRLDEAQSRPGPQTPDQESADSDGSQDDPSPPPGAEPIAENAADPGNAAEQDDQARQPPTTEQANGDEDPGADQQPASSRPGEERQPDTAEQSPDAKAQETGEQNGAEDQSQSGDAQSTKSSRGNREAGNQTSRNGTSGRQQAPPSPGQEAADDEALERLFREYADDIKRQQQAEQQQRASDQQADEQADGSSQPGSESNDGNQSDSQRQTDSDATNDDAGAGDRDPSSDATSGRSPQTDRQQQDTQRGNQPRPGNDPSAGHPPTPDQNRGSPEIPRTDPRANQDPRTADENRSSDGRQPQDTRDASSDNRPNDATPMPNQGEASPDAETSDAQPNSDPSAAGEPTEEKPTGRQSPQRSQSPEVPPNGDPQENQPGDAGGENANDQNTTDPARTGDQPNGADNSDPGEGRPNGQRSEQPSAGERGRSQQSNDGSPSGDQPGKGDPGQSPGSKTKGNGTGSPSPGQGKPSGDQPGESQPGGKGTSSKGGDNARESATGDSPTPNDDSRPGSESETNRSGNDGGPEGDDADPSRPSSDTDTASPSDDQPSGDRDQPEASDAAEDAQKPDGKQGNKSGGKQSGSPQEKSSGAGGEQKGGEQGGGEQGGGEQGGGEQGGGKQGGGKQGGGKQGGGEQGAEGGGGAGEAPPGGSSPSPGRGGGETGGARAPGGGTGSDKSRQPGSGAGDGAVDNAQPAEAANLEDKKRATELVLRKLQDELSRGDVSPELLQDLGWTEDKLRDFMDRLDRRLSDTGDDQSPDTQARRRQFQEILRGIDYSSEGSRRAAEATDRPVEAGSGTIPRRAAPTEFQQIEESFRQKLSRETRSK